MRSRTLQANPDDCSSSRPPRVSRSSSRTSTRGCDEVRSARRRSLRLASRTDSSSSVLLSLSPIPSREMGIASGCRCTHLPRSAHSKDVRRTAAYRRHRRLHVPTSGRTRGVRVDSDRSKLVTVTPYRCRRHRCQPLDLSRGLGVDRACASGHSTPAARQASSGAPRLKFQETEDSPREVTKEHNVRCRARLPERSTGGCGAIH